MFPNVTSILKAGFDAAHTISPNGGLCLEFGVGGGNSFCWQLQQIVERKLGSRIVGFDSFKGLPKETDGVWCPERHEEGCFNYHAGEVMGHIVEMGLMECNIVGDSKLHPTFQLISGFFEESLTNELQAELIKEELVFVNIDVDIHKSTIQALDFIKPMIRPGLVIYFDDWLDPTDIPHATGSWGEHRAWAEWSEANGVSAILGEMNNVNQRYLIIDDVQ